MALRLSTGMRTAMMNGTAFKTLMGIQDTQGKLVMTS